MNKSAIRANHIRYIKLGREGKWEPECIEKGIVRIGFSTQEFIDLFPSEEWEKAFIKYYEHKSKGTITNYINQVRSFFNDDGQTLWVTFFQRRLWWTFVDPSQQAIKHEDGQGTFRKTISGWKSEDIHGQPLDMNSLSGNLTKVAGYQGTSCEVGKEEKQYVLRRINGEPTPSATEAQSLCEKLKVTIVQMMRLLTPKDFELLVDLVFASSGWRRLSVVGGTEKTIDMELVLPTTGEKAFIQVKSKTSQREFDEEYLEPFQEMSQFGRMFFVFHTSGDNGIKCPDANVSIIGAEQFAEMVLDAGLISWLINKVK